MHLVKLYQHEYKGIYTDNYYSILSDKDNNKADENEVMYESAFDKEMANVRVGIGGGFDHSTELKVLNYKQVMVSNKKAE